MKPETIKEMRAETDSSGDYVARAFLTTCDNTIIGFHRPSFPEPSKTHLIRCKLLDITQKHLRLFERGKMASGRKDLVVADRGLGTHARTGFGT
jgi:hypothetical protein